MQLVACDMRIPIQKMLPICDGMAKSFVNSISIAFAPISTWTDSFGTFTVRPTESTQYDYMLSHFCCRIHMPHSAYEESYLNLTKTFHRSTD